MESVRIVLHTGAGAARRRRPRVARIAAAGHAASSSLGKTYRMRGTRVCGHLPIRAHPGERGRGVKRAADRYNPTTACHPVRARSPVPSRPGLSASYERPSCCRQAPARPPRVACTVAIGAGGGGSGRGTVAPTSVAPHRVMARRDARSGSVRRAAGIPLLVDPERRTLRRRRWMVVASSRVARSHAPGRVRTAAVAPALGCPLPPLAPRSRAAAHGARRTGGVGWSRRWPWAGVSSGRSMSVSCRSRLSGGRGEQPCSLSAYWSLSSVDGM